MKQGAQQAEVHKVERKKSNGIRVRERESTFFLGRGKQTAYQSELEIVVASKVSFLCLPLPPFIRSSRLASLLFVYLTEVAPPPSLLLAV